MPLISFGIYRPVSRVHDAPPGHGGSPKEFYV